MAAQPIKDMGSKAIPAAYAIAIKGFGSNAIPACNAVNTLPMKEPAKSLEGRMGEGRDFSGSLA